MAVETRYTHLKFGDIFIVTLAHKTRPKIRVSWGKKGYVDFSGGNLALDEEYVHVKLTKENTIVSVVGNIGNELKHLQALLDETFLEE